MTVSVGDAASATTNNIWIEGVQLLNYVKLGANVFATKSLKVNVTHGRLAMGIGSAATGTTRLNFIEVVVG